ncbi:MAG: S8 family serine peptidase, partial [Planctomycetota bacterium]
NGADILNNSWGSLTTPWPIVHSGIIDVTKSGGIGRNGKGCVVLFATGNHSDFVRYPARYPEVIAVGAADHNNLRCSYSNYGPELDIVAPSAWQVTEEDWMSSNARGALWTTDITGVAGYSEWNSVFGLDPEMLDYTGVMSGTSGSTPIVAGVAALILSVEPNLTNEEVRHLLCRSTKDLGDPGWDEYYGHGRVDARAAVELTMAARADLNDDHQVNLRDFSKLARYWMKDEALVDIYPPPRGDGVIDVRDVVTMGEYWLREIPDVSLIAHWKLDETEGTVAYDDVGSNHSALNGNPVWQPTNGMVDGALQFDGTDDYISTDFVLNPVSGSFSVFAWIKGGAPGQVIISQTDGTGSGSAWLCTEASEGRLMTTLMDAFFPPLESESVITDGQWRHVGLVYDLDVFHRHLYVDGTEVAKDTSIVGGVSSDGGLYIGAGKNLEEGSFFSGLIDDVRIYDVALSAKEIEELVR